MATTLVLEPPSLTALANDLVRIDPEGTHRVYYHGIVLAVWETGDPYLIPGVAEVADVFPLDGLIQLLTTDQDVGVYAEPVAPFRIEIDPGQLIDSPVLSPGLAHPSSSRGLDRADPQVARAIVERLLLPAQRDPFLQLLVQSIQRVHAVHPGCWSLTLDSAYLRLNVGRMEVCAIFPSQGHLVLDEAALTDATRTEAEQYALLHHPGVYRTVPTSLLGDFLSEHLPSLLPILDPSYHSLLQKAAQTVRRRTNYAASHASGLVQYLREATGLAVPDPVY